MNLSCSGAQIALHNALREGEGAFLKCADLDQFGFVVRSETGINAMHFEEPISTEKVIEIRRFHEEFEERERRNLVETVRSWVNGDTKDIRKT